MGRFHFFVFNSFSLLLVPTIVNPVLGVEPPLLWTDGRRGRPVLESYSKIVFVFFFFPSDLDRYRIRKIHTNVFWDRGEILYLYQNFQTSNRKEN